MKRVFSIGVVLLATVVMARPPNYDESKVAPYTLEDPLEFADGTKLSDVAQWPARRAEIVRIFEREMYGRTPPKPEAVVTELSEEGPTLGGQAIRRQYRMWFKADKSGPSLDWLVIIPNRLGNGRSVVRDGKIVCETVTKVPVLLFLNYYGNHELLDDEEVFVPKDAWLRDNATHGIVGHRIVRPQRGAQRKTTGDSTFPIETIVGRGYAVISACYGQVSPDVEVSRGDSEELAYTGVFDLWPKRDPQATDNVTALGAWAWALSRGLDLATEIPEIDARKSVATGCSRLAKTALLACSRDERFAVCAPCQTGGGGCPLAKRDFGENVSTEMQTFPHWYCRAYGKYVDNEQSMKFDQHLLLASIAPRALLVEGFNEGWFDTKGEYLACRAASPVWMFLGKSGLPDGVFPPNYDTSLVGPSFGYVRRGGAHGISGSDWCWTLDFADGALKDQDASRVLSLAGDGVQDDTAAIQARLDSDAACVYLPPPKKCYRISRTLRIGSDTELRLDRFSVIRLAPGSDCPMIENRGYVGGDDRRIAITGGIWDMANDDQSPNPQQYRHCKPPREGGLPPKHDNDFFFGMAMRFSHVEGMTVKGVTVRNPTSYGMAFCHTSYFLIDDIAFDYRTCNPIFLNMDGVHLDGWCHHGRISNLRGTCYDDLVALNANDGQCAQEEGDITDVDIEGVYADYCHSAVRLLSTGANLKRVTIRNVHGNFYTYAVGLTHYFGERKTRGVFDDIVISDVFMGKAFSPENIGVHSRTNFPPIWVEGAVDVGNLTISNFNRDEHSIPVPTIRVEAPATVGRLTVRDCKVINRLKTPLPFLDIRGKVEKRTLENNVFLDSANRKEEVR